MSGKTQPPSRIPKLGASSSASRRKRYSQNSYTEKKSWSTATASSPKVGVLSGGHHASESLVPSTSCSQKPISSKPKSPLKLPSRHPVPPVQLGNDFNHKAAQGEGNYPLEKPHKDLQNPAASMKNDGKMETEAFKELPSLADTSAESDHFSYKIDGASKLEWLEKISSVSSERVSSTDPQRHAKIEIANEPSVAISILEKVENTVPLKERESREVQVTGAAGYKWTLLCSQNTSVEELDKNDMEGLYSSTSEHSVCIGKESYLKTTDTIPQKYLKSLTDQGTYENVPISAGDEMVHAVTDNDETDMDIIQTEFETDTEYEIANDNCKDMLMTNFEAVVGCEELDLGVHSLPTWSNSSLKKVLSPVKSVSKKPYSVQSLYKNPNTRRMSLTQVDTGANSDSSWEWRNDTESVERLADNTISMKSYSPSDAKDQATSPDKNVLAWNIPKRIILKRTRIRNVLAKTVPIHNPTLQLQAFKICFRTSPPSVFSAVPCAGVVQPGATALIEIRGKQKNLENLSDEKILVRIFPIKKSQACMAIQSFSSFPIEDSKDVLIKTIEKVFFWNEGNLKEKLEFFRSISNEEERELLKMDASSHSMTSLTSCLSPGLQPSKGSTSYLINELTTQTRISQTHVKESFSEMNTYKNAVIVLGVIIVIAMMALYGVGQISHMLTKSRRQPPPTEEVEKPQSENILHVALRTLGLE